MILQGDLWHRSITRPRRRRTPASAPAAAAPVAVIADSTMIEPCSKQRFDFFTFPTISAGEVAFQGQSARNNYRTSSGTLTCNVRPGDPAPDGGKFEGFGLPLINFGTVAFWAQTTEHTGIYAKSGSKDPLVVANTDTIIPGRGVPFASFASSPAVEVQQYAFIGSDSGSYTGVFASNAIVPPIRIADTDTQIPGGSGNFTTLSNPAISTRGVAFFGSRATSGKATDAGLYFGGGTPLQVVADLQTAAPDGGTFTGFGQPDVDGETVAFHAITSQGNEGMYAATPGSAPSLIADLNTPVPGGSGTFTAFQSDPAADGGMVAFRGYSDIGAGLYLWNGSSLSKIIDENDTIGGSGILYFGFGTNDLSKGEIAFYAVLTNHVIGIYRMPVLE